MQPVSQGTLGPRQLHNRWVGSGYDSPARWPASPALPRSPRDSGRISGNFHRPKRYDRRLLNTFYLAAPAARYCPQSRSYYQRKRTEGKNHKQAVLSRPNPVICHRVSAAHNRGQFLKGYPPRLLPRGATPIAPKKLSRG